MKKKIGKKLSISKETVARLDLAYGGVYTDTFDPNPSNLGVASCPQDCPPPSAGCTQGPGCASVWPNCNFTQPK